MVAVLCPERPTHKQVIVDNCDYCTTYSSFVTLDCKCTSRQWKDCTCEDKGMWGVTQFRWPEKSFGRQMMDRTAFGIADPQLVMKMKTKGSKAHMITLNHCPIYLSPWSLDPLADLGQEIYSKTEPHLTLKKQVGWGTSLVKGQLKGNNVGFILYSMPLSTRFSFWF